MHSAKLLVALAAGLVSAKSCTKDVKITSSNQDPGCDTADKNVIIDSEVAGQLILSTLEEIKGDLIITNATKLNSISSSTLKSIDGTFRLGNLPELRSIQMSSLETINVIEITAIPFLDTLVFGSDGVTKASKISIADTRLSDLSGLKFKEIDSFSINANPQLKTFSSDIEKINDEFIVSNNGKDMVISMKKLKSAGEIQLDHIKSFEVPALKTAGAIKLNKNEELQSFSAPKLEIANKSITFIDNKKLNNVSFPALTEIGDMTIQNNTAMDEIAGFPQLSRVNGAILLLGKFEKVELPKLKSVTGTATVSSTTDIESFCEYFKKAKSDGIISGEKTCTWNNPKALEGGKESSKEGDSTDGSSGGGSGGDKSNNKDDDGAAGSVRASLAMLGLALVAGLVQLL